MSYNNFHRLQIEKKVLSSLVDNLLPPPPPLLMDYSLKKEREKAGGKIAFEYYDQSMSI